MGSQCTVGSTANDSGLLILTIRFYVAEVVLPARACDSQAMAIVYAPQWLKEGR